MRVRDALLNGPLGFGTAPLGNMFRDIPETEALATLAEAWATGTRFFDTAPFYGAGLAEVRLGKELSKHERAEYVLSTKVGRLISDEVVPAPQEFGEKGTLFQHGRKNRVDHDYSGDGAKRSIEGSLKRLGVDRIDFVWIHDIAADFHGDAWLSMFEAAHKGAMPVLDSLRDEGVIKGWGIGVNRVEAVELLIGLTDVRPDGALLAGRYTLLDHELALQRLMPAAAERNFDIVVGGPYSSGILAGGQTFEYGDAPPQILERVGKLKQVADRYRVPIKAAAIQFILANPASAAVVAGASRPGRIKEDHAALSAEIPDDFWRELRAEKLVAPDAPLPNRSP